MKITFRLSAIACACACALLAIACSKKNDPIEPVEDGTTITPLGSPVGTVVSKTIGAAGGQLTSNDGRIQITIPAGALNAPKEISLQPITNELPDGIGNGFRLMPHGEQFSKPVTITFSYTEADLKTTLPEFLDIAYQDPEGSWLAITNPALDKLNKKVSVTTTHFSDWTFFKSLIMEPAEATVPLGGELGVRVITHFPYMDPDDAAPGTDPVKVLKYPRELRPHEIRGWTYTGEGILSSRVGQAYYSAPTKLPDANPEAVVANIRMARKGQFMLVCNITVVSESDVKYLQVDENYKSPINNGNCGLYIYGSFGNDPGAGNRSVKINGTAVQLDIWSPTMIRCFIDREISGEIEISANNKVISRSALKKYTGSFIYQRFHGGNLNAGSPNPLKETSEFRIVYRGFGKPKPAGLNVMPVNNIAAFGTRSDYTLSGSASVTTPTACPETNSVSLPASTGTILANTISPTSSNFTCDVKDITGGIEIKIDYSVYDVVTGIRIQYSNCNYSSQSQPKSFGCGIEGFSNDPINLAFTNNMGLVLQNATVLTSARMASGILIEAWDGTGSPSHYETDGLMPATFRNKQ